MSTDSSDSHAASMSSNNSLRDEIADLEARLEKAREKLRAQDSGNAVVSVSAGAPIPKLFPDHALLSSPYHFLLLLSDSALPLGSFAFSSGLESYLAHTRPPSFPTFLSLSLSSYASTTLPFVLSAYRSPSSLLSLDDTLDASIMCTVGRRASVAQGRALLGIWDRSFLPSLPPSVSQTPDVQVVKNFSAALKSSNQASAADGEIPAASAHLAPLFGIICKISGLTEEQTAYVFMLSHVKALLSAAVRASMFGPYQAQKVLASGGVQEGIRRVVEREWRTEVEDAGQCVPCVDFWVGRHEMLYSRIFNS